MCLLAVAKIRAKFFPRKRKFKLIEIQAQILQFRWLHECEIAVFENEILRSIAKKTFAGKRTNFPESLPNDKY